MGDLLIYYRALNSVGWMYGELQDFDQAIEWNTKGFEGSLAAGFPNPEIECNAALNLGDNFLTLGELDKAEERFRWVEKFYRDPTPPQRFMLWRYAQHMLHSSGELELRRGHLDRARTYADECVDLAEGAGSRKNVVKGRRLRGQVMAAVGNLDEARAEIDAALELAREISNPAQLWKTLVALGDVSAASDDAPGAGSAYTEALTIVERIGSDLTDESLRDTFLSSAEVGSIRDKAG
jgi:tetratricopeptide (TPR) repeat protein